ncbi:MAG: YidC/Oxa1 family rane protein insertase [Solirubrobacteraceae bacterium]|nr:YidC/Oxa1 family rane protein insertase [Solirubrobacteraceae bacterium]
MTTVFASNPLQPLIDVFEAVLKFFHDQIGLEWGLAIVVLTIVVRACLLPLTLKQFKSMQSMAAHGPEIKKLQARYKDDKERLNQEMMKFYRENKINPFASCLPMVAQLPVFLSLYYMLRTDLRRDICPQINAHLATPKPCGATADSGFLFIHDLTDKATGGVLIALIVLYVGSQLFSTLLMSTTTDKTQRMIFIALPFFFVLFVINFPAGLLVYWITTNLWTIVQQMIVRRRLGPLRPPGSDSGGLNLGELLRGGSSATTSSTVPADGDGGTTRTRPRARASSGEREKQPAARPAGPPPSPPRRKKKRSGRRR